MPHRFKRFAALLLTVTMLTGCGAGGALSATPLTTGAKPNIKIMASFYPIYIMALNIAGNVPGVQVLSMAQPTAGCLHDYSLSTADRKHLDEADILVINGAGMESFLDKVIAQKPDLSVIDSSQGIQLIQDQNGPNAHLWVSITDAMAQVGNIAQGLRRLDSAHADAYQANADAYIAKLQALKTQMHAALDGLPHRDIVTFHEAFPYFAQEFNLNIVGIVEHEPGTEPSARELSDTIDLVKRLGVRALFTEPQYPASSARTIAQETGSSVYELDPAVTGPLDADAYIKTMQANLKVLQEALK